MQSRTRQKLKSGKITLAQPGQTFDLRGEYVGGQPDNSAAVEVDNPHNSAQKITVFRSIRDPLAGMHSRKDIDDCQYLAARKWQGYYESAELGGLQGIDTTRDYVDGGQIAQSAITDHQARAMQKLRHSHEALGHYGWALVFDVLAEHRTIAQCAAKRMMARQRELEFLGRRFAECLNTLAIIYDLAHKPT